MGRLEELGLKVTSAKVEVKVEAELGNSKNTNINIHSAIEYDHSGYRTHHLLLQVEQLKWL